MICNFFFYSIHKKHSELCLIPWGKQATALTLREESLDFTGEDTSERLGAEFKG